MATALYRPGNPFIDRMTVADAAVQWQRLTADQQALVVVEDGLPYLAGLPELRQRAEALVDAAERNKVSGLTHNEDGYPLQIEAMRLDRVAVHAFIGEVAESVAPIRQEAPLADRLLRAKEAYERLGLSRPTFYRRINEGRIEKAHVEDPPRWRASYIDSLMQTRDSEDI